MQVQVAATAPIVQADSTPDQAALALANAKVNQIIQARVQAGADGGAILNLLGNNFRMPPTLDLPIGAQLMLQVTENANGKLQLDLFTAQDGKVRTSSQKSGDSTLAPELGNYEATVELEIPAAEVVSRKASASDANWQALKDEDFAQNEQAATAESQAESETPARSTSSPPSETAGEPGSASASTSPRPAATGDAIRQTLLDAARAPELPRAGADAQIPAAVAERLDAYLAFARESADATAAGELPAVMQQKAELQLNLPADAAPVAAALARTGLPATPENVTQIRQALALGRAQSAETLSWLHAAQLEATPDNTAALDSMLAPNAEKIGALLAKSAPETAETLRPMLLNPEQTPAEVATVLREVLTHLTQAEASASNAANQAVQGGFVSRPDGTFTAADPHAVDVATNLRGQLLLPAVQARTDAPPQGLYLQMPVQAGRQWRTMELKISRRPSGRRELPDITDIAVRLDTAAFGPVDARLTALGRNVALAFAFQNSAALRTFQDAQEELRAGLAEQNVACGAIVCRVAGSLPPLTHDGPISVDTRG